jgi:hypothetical protein
MAEQKREQAALQVLLRVAPAWVDPIREEVWDLVQERERLTALAQELVRADPELVQADLQGEMMWLEEVARALTLALVQAQSALARASAPARSRQKARPPARGRPPPDQLSDPVPFPRSRVHRKG